MNEAAILMWLKSIKIMLNQKGVLQEELLQLTENGWRFSFCLYPVGTNRRYTLPESLHFVGASSVELMETVNRWVAEYGEPVKEAKEVWYIFDDALPITAGVALPRPQPAGNALNDWRALNAAYNKNPRNHKGKI